MIEPYPALTRVVLIYEAKEDSLNGQAQTSMLLEVNNHEVGPGKNTYAQLSRPLNV